MDAATLQSRIYRGYNSAALRIGYMFTLYRPISTGPVIAGANLIGSPINAAFTVNSSSFNFNKAGKHDDALWLGLFDGTTTRPGDYLYNPTHGTYYIAAQQDELPILCVKCNHALTVLRPNGPPSIGLDSYSGVTPANETASLTSWPGTVLYDARGRQHLTAVPMDNSPAIFNLMLPAYPGVDIRPSDIITDDNVPSRRYVAMATELTALGWYIVAQQALA